MALPAIGAFDPIDETLATHAVRRHRVGPLLHLACQDCADLVADEKASAILRSSYHDNVYASLRQKAAERKISDLLISHSVPYSFLKGCGLAGQLHANPSARQSKDIDILVSPDHASHVITLLTDHEYIYKSFGLRRKKLFELSRQNMDIRLFKDLTFFDPNFSVPVELHSRLFKFEPNSLTSDFNNSVQFSPIPSLTNSLYCLYLILHGAIALWPRLKWVVDLSIMARKMPLQSRTDMIDIAKSYGCEEAVIASLLMTEEIFAGSLDDEWQDLIEIYPANGSRHKMRELFYKTLTARTIGKAPLPLKSHIFSGSADFIFRGKISRLESLFKHFLHYASLRI